MGTRVLRYALTQIHGISPGAYAGTQIPSFKDHPSLFSFSPLSGRFLFGLLMRVSGYPALQVRAYAGPRLCRGAPAMPPAL